MRCRQRHGFHWTVISGPIKCPNRKKRCWGFNLCQKFCCAVVQIWAFVKLWMKSFFYQRNNKATRVNLDCYEISRRGLFQMVIWEAFHKNYEKPTFFDNITRDKLFIPLVGRICTEILLMIN